MKEKGEPVAPPNSIPLENGQHNTIFFDEVNMKPLEEYRTFLASNNLNDDLDASVLYQVYQDLRLIRKWTNLRVVRRQTRLYLAGSAAPTYDSVFPNHNNKDDIDRTQVVVPITACKQLSPREMQLLCQECVHPETEMSLRCITVAIVDDDSTTAYYRIFDKWDEIIHPQWKSKKKRKGEEGNGSDEDNSEAPSEGFDTDSD